MQGWLNVLENVSDKIPSFGYGIHFRRVSRYIWHEILGFRPGISCTWDSRCINAQISNFECGIHWTRVCRYILHEILGFRPVISCTCVRIYIIDQIQSFGYGIHCRRVSRYIWHEIPGLRPGFLMHLCYIIDLIPRFCVRFSIYKGKEIYLTSDFGLKAQYFMHIG